MISLLGLILATQQAPAKAPVDLEAANKKYRDAREARLKGPENWLAVAGLFWLNKGSNTFGSANSNTIVFPASAPPSAGTFELVNGKVTMTLVDDVKATIKGQPVTGSIILNNDSEENSQKVKIGDLVFRIIKRQDKIGVRLWDANSEGRREFKGIPYYKFDPKWQIKGTFVAYAKPKMVPIANVLGQIEPTPHTGYVKFKIGKKEFRLDAQDEGDVLFIIFADTTNKTTTYPSGRFLYPLKPVNNEVLLDFNESQNPPCAFTNFATCPLPPRQNRMNVAIPAGEKAYHLSDH